MIARFNGNVVPFADDATSTNRTVFGGTTQSDLIDDNLNTNFKKGWEIVGLNDNPTREDFNAMGYTLGALTAYLYEMGISEWNASQNYRINSRVIGSDGNIYKALTGTTGTPNVNHNPTSDAINWELEFKNFVDLINNQTIAGIKTFSSNIVGSITGNSATATKLQTAKTINGVLFDGSENISVGLNNQSAVFTTALTLNATHKNKVLLYSGTFNITLPTVGTIKSGDLFIIDNFGTGTLSLVTNGNNTDLSRLTVLAGEVLILQSDGGSFYRFISRSKDYASNINPAAGYTYLPNGILMQWGYGIGINIPPNMGTLDITFPITFPNGVFYSNVAIVNTSINSQISTPFCVATSTSILHIKNTDVDSPITQIRWFAIGH